MSVQVLIERGALAPMPSHGWPGAGAVLCFEGVIRPEEGDRRIDAIEYEVYRPMAERVLESLARQAKEAHGLLAVRVWHSEGRVPVGACSFRLEVASAHRAEGLAAMGWFIDAMKRDAPIWKRICEADSPQRAAP